MELIWLDAVRTLGGKPVDAGDLVDRYAEPHRRYHNAEHVRAVVRDAAMLAADLRFSTEDRAILTLAALAHDVVYDAKPGDDERASAIWAREHLTGVPEQHVARVEELVLATITHVGNDPLAAALLDADLAILGAAPEVYDRYTVAVRQEYARYDDATWRAGRTMVMSGLLERRPLYITKPAQRRWEAAAKSNITRELEALQPPG